MGHLFMMSMQKEGFLLEITGCNIAKGNWRTHWFRGEQEAFEVEFCLFDIKKLLLETKKFCKVMR